MLCWWRMIDIEYDGNPDDVPLPFGFDDDLVDLDDAMRAAAECGAEVLLAEVKARDDEPLDRNGRAAWIANGVVVGPFADQACLTPALPNLPSHLEPWGPRHICWTQRDTVLETPHDARLLATPTSVRVPFARGRGGR